MSAYERLMAEEWPPGSFGYPPARPAPPPRPIRPWTPEEQAQHLADLLTALDGWHSDDDHDIRKRERHRHLRLIADQPDQSQPDAA